jgi:hypothetical protein
MLTAVRDRRPRRVRVAAGFPWQTLLLRAYFVRSVRVARFTLAPASGLLGEKVLRANRSRWTSSWCFSDLQSHQFDRVCDPLDMWIRDRSGRFLSLDTVRSQDRMSAPPTPVVTKNAVLYSVVSRAGKAAAQPLFVTLRRSSWLTRRRH